MSEQLTAQECEQRFWMQFGPYLFGEKRKPQNAQEWIDAGRQLRGVQQLDQIAARVAHQVEEAVKAQLAPPQRPAQRQRTGQEGDLYYDGEGRACCPIHERPLKEGRWGWYCSAKDERGKNGYCDFRIKEL